MGDRSGCHHCDLADLQLHALSASVYALLWNRSPEGFLKKGYRAWDRYDRDLQLAIVEAALNKTAMTTSTHRHHGYELVLHRKSDDRYQVIIFDPKGNRIASTEVHLERQGALTEASEYVDHLIAKRRA